MSHLLELGDLICCSIRVIYNNINILKLLHYNVYLGTKKELFNSLENENELYMTNDKIINFINSIDDVFDNIDDTTQLTLSLKSINKKKIWVIKPINFNKFKKFSILRLNTSKKNKQKFINNLVYLNTGQYYNLSTYCYRIITKSLKKAIYFKEIKHLFFFHYYDAFFNLIKKNKIYIVNQNG